MHWYNIPAVIFLLLVISIHGEELKTVYFSFIVSGGEHGYRSSGVVPSIDIALEAAQEQQMLPGYNLTYQTVKDSKCHRTTSLDVFMEDVISSRERKIALLGCGCSSATEPVAEISSYWNITQISFASSSQTLADQKRFRNVFRTVPSMVHYATALLAILKKFNWKRLAVITENENIFLNVEEVLHGVANDTCCFESPEIIIQSSTSFNKHSTDAVREIFDDVSFHVFFVNGYYLFARRVICEALQRNLVYPNYGWIMFSWYPDRWWTEEVAGEHIEDCSDDEMETFLKMAQPLLINTLPSPRDYNDQTDSGFSTREFIARYNSKLYPRSEYRKPSVYLIAFDAMWSLVKVLNYTEDLRLRNFSRDSPILNICRNLPGDLVSLDEFDYSNAFMGCVMRESFYRIRFIGVSGPVSFSSDGTIILNQIRMFHMDSVNGKLEVTRFGYLDTKSNYTLVYDPGKSDETIYPEGFPPDGTPLAEIHTYHMAIVVTIYFLAVCGNMFSFALFIFNYAFRKKRVIRLTTPRVNFLVIAGAVLLYTSAFIRTFPTTEKHVFHTKCIVQVWFYGIGYCVVYGSILAKMWRVNQIFHNPNPAKQILKTWQLVGIVAIISSIGALIILGRSISQIIITPKLIADTVHPKKFTSSHVLVNNKVWQCYEPGSPTFVIDVILLIYCCTLQTAGIILALQIRKVKMPVLNDSKSVTVLVYISSILFVMVNLIAYIVRNYININAAVHSGGSILLATVILSLVFIPKFVHLYRDPTGDKLSSAMNPSDLMGQQSQTQQRVGEIALAKVEDKKNKDRPNPHSNDSEE